MSDQTYSNQAVAKPVTTKTSFQIAETCSIYLMQDLRRYAASIPEVERQDYFDPRNADTWKRGFADWLSTVRREFASND